VQENLSRIQNEFNLIKEQLGITSSLVGTNKMDDIFIRDDTQIESQDEPEAPSTNQRPKIEVLGQTTQLPDGSIGIYEEFKEGKVGVVGRTAQLPDGTVEILEEYMEDEPPKPSIQVVQQEKKSRPSLFIDEDLELLQRFSKLEQEQTTVPETPIETPQQQTPLQRPTMMMPQVKPSSSPPTQTNPTKMTRTQQTSEPAVRETIIERFSQPSSDLAPSPFPSTSPFIRPTSGQVESSSLPSQSLPPVRTGGPTLPMVLPSTQGPRASVPGLQTPLLVQLQRSQEHPNTQQPEKKVSLFKQRQQQQGKS